MRTSTKATKQIDQSRHPRVVVVEDDAYVLHELKDSLDSQGFETRVTVNWRQAADFVARSKPDLVILDIEKGCGVGWKVLDTLKHERETRGIPVIVWCTAAAAVSENVRAFREYGVDVVSKTAQAGYVLLRAKALLTERMSSTPCQVTCQNPSVGPGQVQTRPECAPPPSPRGAASPSVRLR